MSFNDADPPFGTVLQAAGWTEVQRYVEYRKRHWRVVFDTSSWIEVGTEHNPRVFDVPVTEPKLHRWTVNLIEHLCSMDDRLRQLEA